MRFRVTHTTRYAYSRPVFIEPHTIRIRPRSDGTQTLRRFAISVDPQPAGRSEILDAEGNTVIRAWFLDLHPALTITTEAVVDTLRSDPFDYILPSPESGTLPLSYDPNTARVLAPHRDDSAVPADARAYAERIAEEAGGELLPFLWGLTDRIHTDHETVIREEGDPFSSEQTLREGMGSCRDLTVLFADCCRHLGIASRFVSGYQEGDPDQTERHLHAWAEVFVPGGGWRGYDPTLALAVADRHVALAAAADATQAAPVSGSFRGTGATARMSTRLAIEAAEPSEPDVEEWRSPR